MNVALYIAKRYLFSKSNQNAINIISSIAALGIVASTFALFVVLSVFSGLKDFSLSFTNAYDPDLKVLPTQQKRFSLSAQQEQQLNNLEGVNVVSRVLQERVLLQFKDKTAPAYFKAVDSNYTKITTIKQQIVYGQWLAEGRYQVVIGSQLQRDLSVGLRDYSGLLNVYVPKPGKGQILDYNQAFDRTSTSVVGIFNLTEELDQNYVIGDITIAQELLRTAPDQVSAIELKLSPSADEAAVVEAIQDIVKVPVEVKNRIALNDSLYKMLNTENLAVYLIFTLVVIIALFNVVGSISMAILDKREHVNVLYKLGASKSTLVRIFFYQGTIMSVLGGLIGLGLGLLLVVLQLKFELIMFTPNLAYPVKIAIENILIVMLTISVLGALASLIASNRVRKII